MERPKLQDTFLMFEEFRYMYENNLVKNGGEHLKEMLFLQKTVLDFCSFFIFRSLIRNLFLLRNIKGIYIIFHDMYIIV